MTAPPSPPGPIEPQVEYLIRASGIDFRIGGNSHALNNATLPFGLALANKGFAAVLENPHLRAGLNVYHGRLTYEAVAESLGLPFFPIEQAAARSEGL